MSSKTNPNAEMYEYEKQKPYISDKIGVLLASGNTQNSIARTLGRSKSSISYKINHNSRYGEYQPILANLLSRERNLISQRQHAKKDRALYQYVIDKHRTVICKETIYRFIYSPEGKKENLKEYLTRAHRKRYFQNFPKQHLKV